MWTEEAKTQVKKDGVTILFQNCDPIQAEDETLPTDSYIVTYEYQGNICYDIVRTSNSVKIFDSYYDRIGNGIKSFKWTKGKSNSRIYGEQPKQERRKR